MRKSAETSSSTLGGSHPRLETITAETIATETIKAESITVEQPEVTAVLAHHRLSSLAPDQAGAMPERLERRNQPVPFRRYLGVPRWPLPDPSADDDPETHGTPASRRASMGRLLAGSLALVGWRRNANAGFGLRVVPSAGNLHPTESYVLAEGLESTPIAPLGSPRRQAATKAGLYHYSPFDHALERRAWLPQPAWESLRSACPEASCFIALSTIYWRCAWKYGERAFRLCQLDAGHAVAALDASAALGRQRVVWVDVADGILANLLGLDENPPPEEEEPLCLLALVPRDQPITPRWHPNASIRSHLAGMDCSGTSSPVEPQPRVWPGLHQVAQATRWRPDVATAMAPMVPPPTILGGSVWPWDILRRRRSRSQYADGPLGAESFSALFRTLSGEGSESSVPCGDDVVPLLFVHRVEGIEPGLYIAAQPTTPLQELRADLRPDLEWREVEMAEPGGAEAGRLICLSRGDARAAAVHLSGGQAAAGSAAFTAVFLARFADTLRTEGGFAYRRLHWRAGELGHRLYLESEALGLGATGLGGFFDDPICQLLGLRDEAWRPLYLLAVGLRDNEDDPLEPPYAHRRLGAEPVAASQGGFHLARESTQE